MKLVLHFKDKLKLYAQAIQYQKLMQFIDAQFRLKKQTINMTFTDEDGDNIELMSQKDFQIMIDCCQNKDYVKINIDGEIDQNIEKQKQSLELSEKILNKNEIENDKQINEQEKKQEIKQELVIQKVQLVKNEVIQNENKQEQKIIIRKSSMQQIADIQQEYKQSDNIVQIKNKKLYSEDQIVQKFTVLLNQKVSLLVDQRISELAEKMKKQQKKDNFAQRQLQNNKFTISFEKDNYITQMQIFIKKCKALSNLFGNQPNEYGQFVQQNCSKLDIKKTLEQYALNVRKMNKQLFQKQYINMICKSLSKDFGKNPEFYRQFVIKNNKLNYKELKKQICRISHQQPEQNKSWWQKMFGIVKQQPKPIYKVQKQDVFSKFSQEQRKKIKKIIDSLSEIFGQNKQYATFIKQRYRKEYAPQLYFDLWMQKISK